MQPFRGTTEVLLFRDGDEVKKLAQAQVQLHDIGPGRNDIGNLEARILS
jgi:hypothetical protein